MRHFRFRPAPFLFLLPVLLLFLACDQEPTAVDTSTVSYAKGGNKGKPSGESGKDLELGEYTVDRGVISAGQGFTNVVEVDDAVYDYLRTDPDLNAQFLDDAGVALDPAVYFGCPKLDLACNRVTLKFTGSAYTLHGSFANMVVGCGLGTADPEWGCMNDEQLGNRRLASTAGGHAFPSIPWTLLEEAIVTDPETGVSQFSYYWQGQRGLTHYGKVGEEKVRGKLRPIYEYTEVWDYLPDIHTVGTQETPVFGFGARLSSLNGNTYFTAWSSYRRLDNCTTDADDCRGAFKGASGAGPLHMWVDLWDVDPTGQVEFAIQAYREDPANFDTDAEGKLIYASLASPDINPDSHSRVMMVSPDGTRTMLNTVSTGRRMGGYDYKVGIAESRYVEDLVEPGCYEFHALSLVARERNAPTWQETFNLNRLRWIPGLGSDGIFRAIVGEGSQGNQVSMDMGVCPPADS